MRRETESVGPEDDGLDETIAEVRGAADQLGRAVASLWLSQGLSLVSRMSGPLAQVVRLLRSVAAHAERVPPDADGAVVRASAALDEAVACLRRAQDELLDAAGALRAAAAPRTLPDHPTITDEMLRQLVETPSEQGRQA